MKIGELARRTGLTIATLRFYEREGLIECQRSKTQYRHFPEESVERVQRILYLRSLNLPLSEIKNLICAGGLAQADPVELSRLEDRLAKITEQRQLLAQLELELRSHISAVRGQAADTT
jgi:MerR family transcriptional regulator, thiopeptide resistance regulator